MRKPQDDALRAAQKAGEKAVVLSSGPIPEVKLGPVQVTGQTPGVADDVQTPIDRTLLDPTQVAPVVADATLRQPFGRKPADEEEEEKPKEAQYFVVLEDRFVTDKTSGARTKLRAGKVISTAHYDIRHLQTQGARLKRTEAPGTTDEPIEELLQ